MRSDADVLSDYHRLTDNGVHNRATDVIFAIGLDVMIRFGLTPGPGRYDGNGVREKGKQPKRNSLALAGLAGNPYMGCFCMIAGNG